MIEKSSSISGTGATGATGTAAVKQTLVEDGTTFKGSLSSNCPIVVKGRIEGDVAAPSLNVSTSGSVHGTVKVTDLRSAGELSGDFESETVQLSGIVKDNTRLRAKSLEVRLAVPQGKMQVIFGECSLEVGDPLTKEDVIKAASQPPVEAKAEEPKPAEAAKTDAPPKAGKSETPAKSDTKATDVAGTGTGKSGGGGGSEPKGASVRPKDGKEEETNGAPAEATK
ncbi:polymer-forming cytoskeletal protein [Pendulispora albinea]|uniref:Polymer-forming cytoskeletal protein n=1 Tax=Pendulispora albinea TaxID=2741071 RepID=A0ABZ2LSC2_9BACT